MSKKRPEFRSPKFIVFALLAVLVVLAAGCKKKSEPAEKKESSAPKAAPPQTVASAADTVLRVHWLGKKRLAAETNAASFVEIWNLPESAKLEAQTLDKLTVAPWHPWKTNATPITDYPALISNLPPAALLRPLLDDLVQEESYLEVRQPTNQPREMALAIRLGEQRAGLWETNLAGVVESLAGNRPVPASGGATGWHLETTHDESPVTNHASRITHHVELTRSGEWTVIGTGPEHNPVLAEIITRIQSQRAPFPTRATNFWLETELDSRFVLSAIAPNLHLPDNLPKISANVIGDGKSVHTHANFDFPQPLPLELEPWNIPTNLIHDPLIGFMAIRGFRPLLKTCKPWNDLQLGTPPNHAFFWAQKGAYNLHFTALPSADASNQVDKLDEFILRDVNPILASNKPRQGAFAKVPNYQRLIWKGIPWFAPTLDFLEPGGNPVIFGGFYGGPLNSRPFPGELLAQVYATTNLVWYDWEITQPCAEGLLQMAQMTRNVFGKARLTDSASLFWLRAIEPKLGNSATAVNLLSPTRLHLTRNSSLGLTGAELQVLMDWLESPEFPYGLRTFLAPPPQRTPGPQTNSPPVIPPGGDTNTAPQPTHGLNP